MPPSFPLWDRQGVIPPFDSHDPTQRPRSPYIVPLVDVIQRFATTSARITILEGFLAYRAALHTAGLDRGFQWLNGSFMENKEAMQRQPPGDIDVVTYFHLPTGQTQAALATSDPLTFGPDGKARKNHYHVDAYLTHLGRKPELLVDTSAYWYGVFAHSRRLFKWKGFLQVNLASTEDGPATALLTKIKGGTSP